MPHPLLIGGLVAARQVSWTLVVGSATPLGWHIERAMETTSRFRRSSMAFPRPLRRLTPTAGSNSRTDTFLAYLGMSLEELKNWETSGVVHPDDLPRVLAIWRQSLQRGEPYEMEHHVYGVPTVPISGFRPEVCRCEIPKAALCAGACCSRTSPTASAPKRSSTARSGSSRWWPPGVLSRTFSRRCAALLTPSSARASAQSS